MKKISAYTVISGILIFASCTSTRITSSWREPDKQVVINQLNKVLVVAMFNNETNRHKAEDQMAGYLNGKAVVSYKYLDNTFNKNNEDALRNKIKADGFDAAVTMRLIDVDKEQTYTPGNLQSYPIYYRNFSGYYYRSWSYYSTPGYYSTTKTYNIEVNVYSIKEDRIIWSGLTATTNPDGVNKLTEEVSMVVFNKMVEQGFISK